MSQCRKFAPNIFNKTKCTNCFRQKEEHSTEALECNRASRKITRSGYLFVAPDWDFSVPLNRTKRWQRRWFVLYDDGELSYSVDEHPDTVPQGRVDMCRVMEVTGAEQVTGHPHSLALTCPDRVTFIKAASREDARAWAELLAVFPRSHKRHATFPGGRASPSLPQLGRSSSPQPGRPRHLSCASARTTTFLTPPLKEEKEEKSEVTSGERKQKKAKASLSMPLPVNTEKISLLTKSEYIVSSGSPPTHDKHQTEEKTLAKQDWQNERLRDIANALTERRTPEANLAPLPAEGLLHLKKGWLWLHSEDGGNSQKRWWVLCGPTLTAFKDQNESTTPEVQIELNVITGFKEVATETRYGFQIEWNGNILLVSAATSNIRSNWLQSLKKAVDSVSIVSSDVPDGKMNFTSSIPAALESPLTPNIQSPLRSILLSSDEEYRTASEGGRRGSEDWGEGPPSPPLTRSSLSRVKERTRSRPRLPRAQSRQSTVDSVSTDELDSAKDVINLELRNSLNRQGAEMDDLKKQLNEATEEVRNLENQLERLKKVHSECLTREKQTHDLLLMFEKTEQELYQRIKQVEEEHCKEQESLEQRLSEAKEAAQYAEDKCSSLTTDLKNKQYLVRTLQDELENLNERLLKNHEENSSLSKRLQHFEVGKTERISRANSLTDLTCINLDINLESLDQNDLIEQYLDLKSRFEKAVAEIKALKRELREANTKYDDIEFQNVNLRKSLENAQKEAESNAVFMAMRVQDLTNKLLAAEKQARTLKTKLQDSREKRRSLSLKGKETLNTNKEVEEKLDELEAKVLTLERIRTKRKHKREVSSERASPIDDRALRRLRRKSLDSSIAAESLRAIMVANNLESKIGDNIGTQMSNPPNYNIKSLDDTKTFETKINIARTKLYDCINQVLVLKGSGKKRASSPSKDRLSVLEAGLNDLKNVLEAFANVSESNTEESVIVSSATSIVQQFEEILRTKLIGLSKQKRKLEKMGQLNNHTRLELLAEKIVFENILIARIQEAFEVKPSSDISCDRLLVKEAIETSHLFTALNSKLNGVSNERYPACKTGVEYLSKILAKRLLLVSENFQSTLSTHQRFKPLANSLKTEHKLLNFEVERYKKAKLSQLADALAAQAVNLSTDASCELPVLDINDLEEIRTKAKEISSNELIEAEINHVLMRSAQIYESTLASDNAFFFSFYASERAALELWNDAVEQYLRTEMQQNVQDLCEQFRDSCMRLQQTEVSKQDLERMSSEANVLLVEFADVIAHKALVDARIAVLTGEFGSRSNSEYTTEYYCATNLLKLDELLDSLSSLDLVQINQNVEAEFKCMLSNAGEKCRDTIGGYDLDSVNSVLSELANEVDRLNGCVGNVQERENLNGNNLPCANWMEVCERCHRLKKQLIGIRKCVEGKEWNRNSKKLDTNEDCFGSRVNMEYITQTETIRSSFRRALAACDNVQHQVELQQLQTLCERALHVLEQWHRQAVNNIREEHDRELAVLRQDKEQALAEETQATLAALDAMRKAHEAEVQREVAKFKQTFSREQQRELLDLTERLSVKCLETAALEEQLGCATKQLAQAHQHILQLKRNPQLSSLQILLF
ncbi:protein outspread isoform X2 [Agrilus planipennis]|uniref:Protein outspread isoform X2 n=1 Tax=Agrilus planipennis TaxID=224129 RepID=A0A1W4WJ60_AGRPL|nr:protein outspread isoform X2 [Agrilus planipennis]